MLTIVDVAHPIDQVLACGGWLADLLAATPVVVLAARATVPGLRRLETCVDLVGAGRVVAAVLGPSRTRWPREISHSLGPLTRALIAAGRLVEIPEDRVLVTLATSSGSVENLDVSERHGCTPYSRHAVAIVPLLDSHIALQPTVRLRHVRVDRLGPGAGYAPRGSHGLSRRHFPKF